MIPSSVRRVAAAAPHQSPILSTLLPRSAAAATYFRPTQRRRYSSSKPSRDNGSEDLPVRQSVGQPSASEAKATEAKTPGEKRKRKAKDAAAKQTFPSVPSTAHIPSEFIALSSFFSLHRPISLTRGLPRNVTEDVFASIFTQPSRSQKLRDTVSTITNAVETIERPAAPAFSHATDGETGSHAGEMMDFRQADMAAQVDKMSEQFRPFCPPPQPQPQPDAAAAAVAEAENGSELLERAAAELDEQSSTRVYKAVFTIEETVDRSGEVRILAHSPQLMDGAAAGENNNNTHITSGMAISVASGAPQTFLERMAMRQLRYEEARRSRETMHAISVKRQRKLKMKKHKYKKLTKRLRHERLKHGRT